MVVPAILQQILHEPDGMEFLARLNFAAVAGAPAAAAVGDKVKSVVELFNLIGSTETFPLPELYKSRDDWLYHEFTPYMKHEMQLHDPAEGTYELVIIADESTKDSCPVYHNVPGVPAFHTKDLFQRHPEKPNLYKYYGRLDDIIVLANGEKVNPIPLEQHVQGHPSINSAVLVGEGRNQTALMLEPTKALDEAERADFLAGIWDWIQESNKYVPGPGRVSRDKIIFAVADKAFPRTAKNTVIRKKAEKAYQEEINAAYLAAAKPASSLANVDLGSTTKTVYTPSKITSFLRQVFAPTFPAASEIEEDEDFFVYGLDSIQILEVTANLQRNLQRQTSSSVGWLTPRTLLRNATFADLSSLLAAFLNDDVVPQEDTQLDRSRALEEAVLRHTADLPQRLAPVAAPPTTSSTTVAFLGSTGYLGTHALASLIQNADIAQVYCLNRSKNAQEKQEAALASLDQSLQSLLHKLIYVQVEIGKPILGLNREQYDLLAEKVDVVVYNSWRLDFSLSLRSFEPFLQTTRELINLSLASKRKIRVIFISSLSSVENLIQSFGTIPEKPVEDPSAALNTGYAQSKLAAEMILLKASQQAGVPISIVRIGQIGGPSSTGTGIWADQQWISAIIHTSKALGCLPNPVLPIDWIPVDTAAAMLQAFVLEPPRGKANVYNVCSDKPQAWDLLNNAAHELLGIKEVVSLSEWVRKLRDIKNPTPEHAGRMPALKMLDWYEALGDGLTANPVATDRAKAVSKVEVPSVDRDLLVSWLRGWGL
jgi:thioester reductase-like protein